MRLQHSTGRQSRLPHLENDVADVILIHLSTVFKLAVCWNRYDTYKYEDKKELPRLMSGEFFLCWHLPIVPGRSMRLQHSTDRQSRLPHLENDVCDVILIHLSSVFKLAVRRNRNDTYKYEDKNKPPRISPWRSFLCWHLPIVPVPLRRSAAPNVGQIRLAV